MTSFREFRDNGPGAAMVQALLGIDISGVMTWAGFTHVALAARPTSGPDDYQPFIDRVHRRAGTASTGELALLMGVLFAMDYRWLAEKIGEEYGRSFLRLMEYTTGEHARAAAACIERSDSQTTMGFDEGLDRLRLAREAVVVGALGNDTAVLATIRQMGLEAFSTEGLRTMLQEATAQLGGIKCS